MAISYNAVIGHKGKVTLPSVESWGTNNNILRDPPKSIMTRRIDKVNEDGSLNEMFYHSGDRFAENINVFARGVNPMVSVQYGNVNGGGSGKLPYRIMNGGAFRPPELRQEQLLPLSRQPRLPTKVESQKGYIDYTKSALCDSQPKIHRQIVQDKIEGFIPPTKTMKIDKPVKEHFVVSYIVENPLRGKYYSNKNYKREQYADDINVELDRNIPEYSAYTNKSENISRFVAPDKEIILDNNLPHYLLQTQKSNNIGGNGVLNNEMTLDNNLPHYLLQSQKSDSKFVRVAHEVDYNFENNMPIATAETNKTENIHVDVGTRVYQRLPEALSLGEFKAVPTIPQRERNIQYNQHYSTSKTEIAKKIMNERK